MDLDKYYKDLRAEHETLSAREQELRNRINEIKKLREIVAQKKANILALEKELGGLLDQ